MDKKIYESGKIEKKWRKKWLDTRLYEVDLADAKKPYYNLMMFPYPSAEGLHVGNMYAFTGADIFGRYQRMLGKDVFEPIGLDGFGMHSENFAIKINKHPKEHATESQKNYYRQLSEIGNGFAWDNKLETYDPDYYRWTQWIFIQMFKNDLAYRSEANVNWCPNCKTVLADEQVINGECERCKNKVKQREMSSWYFRITKYADRLLDNIEKIDWPERIKIAQRSWIGKKEGIDIEYEVENSKERLICWTSRPDTNFGATFLVLAPEHPLALKLTNNDNRKKVSKYIVSTQKKSKEDRLEGGKEKTGVFTGSYAINNLNGFKMPIWISDFVLAGVGTGAVVGVPGHDVRDFEFARKYGLKIIRVVVGSDEDRSPITKIEQVQEEEGKMVNSEFLNGMEIHEATVKMMDFIEKKKYGKRATSYHLRDWLISRQRYWGPPIPMIHCKFCEEKGRGEKKSMPGWYTALESELPVRLPEIDDYKPKGDGTSPLSNAPEGWQETECPGCGKKAQRELDISDTFLDSAWYFLRYPSVDNEQSPWGSKVTKKWLPVDAYIGGAEHAVLHLLYARFVTMAFKDWGMVDFEEPFPYLFGHGLIIKDGAKMSKSRGNVVIPDDYIKKFGSDAFRMYLMFLGPFDRGGDFKDSGIEGMRRFIEKVWRLSQVQSTNSKDRDGEKVLRKMHQTIKKVTKDIEGFKYNTAISAIMEYVNLLREQVPKSEDNKSDSPKQWHEAIRVLVLLLAPFAPHMTEEIWVNVLGEKYSIHKAPWPEYDVKYIKVDNVEIVIQVNGKLRNTLKVTSDKSKVKEEVLKLARGDEKIKKWISGKKIKKEIFVPGKLVNFVVAG